MNKTYNPIKRSRQLAALSRDHHETLLFVWKIKQGLIYNIPAERIARYCEWFWSTNLKEHFRKEEEGFSKLLPPSDPLLLTMFDDHEAIAAKLQQVTDDPSNYLLQRLAQIIYYHIRFEERSLFTHAEEVASAETLDEVASLLVHDKTNATEWADEFWIKPKSQSSKIFFPKQTFSVNRANLLSN